MALSQVYDQVAQCSRCGFCQPTCLTYLISGKEGEVARGRNQLVRAIIEGRMELTKDMKEPLFQCLMCNACYTNCFPKIKTDRVIAQARHALIRNFGQPILQRFIFQSLLRRPEALGRYIKLAGFGKRSGLSGMVQALRLLGWYGKNIANAEGLLASIPNSFLRERISGLNLQPEKPRGKLAYFVGCGINFAHPEVGLATLELMLLRGFSVEVLANYCCGLPAYAYGDLDSVQWFAKENLSILAATDADYIITDCASCTSFLKEYAELLSTSEFSTTAEHVTKKIMDVTQWLHETEDTARYLSSNGNEQITYHDPCHLAHHLNQRQAPRQVLGNLPSVDYVPLPEADFCCGGAGSYNIAHYDLSMQILDRKMQNVASTGADVLATACPACLIQLDYGVRRQHLPVKVKHVTQIVREHSVGAELPLQ